MPSDDNVDDNENEPQQGDPNLRVLRDKAKGYDALQRQLDEANARTASLERENAFRAAGIDPTDAKAKYFVKAYDGELDVAAIKTEAETAGVLTPSAPAPPAEDLAAFERFGQAAAGAPGGGTPPTHWDELNDKQSPEQIAEVLMRHGQPVAHNGPVDGGFFSSMP